MLELIKQEFREIGCKMWPTGVPNRIQFRDVFWVFLSGWLASRLNSPDEEIIINTEIWMREHQYMSLDNWWPDDSWRWWL